MYAFTAVHSTLQRLCRLHIYTDVGAPIVSYAVYTGIDVCTTLSVNKH